MLQWSKNKRKLIWNVFACVLFFVAAIMRFYEYSESGKKIDIILAIVFGLFAIVRLFDVFRTGREADNQLNQNG